MFKQSILVKYEEIFRRIFVLEGGESVVFFVMSAKLFNCLKYYQMSEYSMEMMKTSRYISQ